MKTQNSILTPIIEELNQRNHRIRASKIKYNVVSVVFRELNIQVIADEDY